MTEDAANFSIQGQVAVVTGGSGVLGAALARGLGAAGARVAVVGRRVEATAAVVQAIRASGGTALAVAADVRDRATVVAAADRITQELGPVDMLINGAGGNDPRTTTTTDQSFFDLDPSAIQDVIMLNVTGSIICAQVFGKGMAARGAGSIINIASMNAFRPLTRIPAYSAAKAAVVNFTQWLAVHMAQTYSPDIRVNAIAPGFFLTDQNRFLLTDGGEGMTARGAAILAHTPQGRFGDPVDLVGAVHWLVSPAARFVTGVVIPIDGGFAAFSGV